MPRFGAQTMPRAGMRGRGSDQDISAILKGLEEQKKLFRQEAAEPEHQGTQDWGTRAGAQKRVQGGGATTPAPAQKPVQKPNPHTIQQQQLLWRYGGKAGIPVNRARDVNEPPAYPKGAAGMLLMAPDGRALFVRRSPTQDHAGEWSLPGGMTEGDELPHDTALRECNEEIGDCGLTKDAMQLMDHTYDNGLGFTTYGAGVEDAFPPKLNGEHDAHQWAQPHSPPQPLHPGLKSTLDFAMDPLTNKGEKILSSMKDQYGAEKGERVFYASANKGTISGVDAPMPNQNSQMMPAPRPNTEQPAQHSQTPFGANLDGPGAMPPPSGNMTRGGFNVPSFAAQGGPGGQAAMQPDDNYSHTFVRKREYTDGTTDQHTTKWSTPRNPQGSQGDQEKAVSPQPLKPPTSTQRPIGPQTLAPPRQGDAGAGFTVPSFSGTRQGNGPPAGFQRVQSAPAQPQGPQGVNDGIGSAAVSGIKSALSVAGRDEVKHDPKSGQFTSGGGGGSKSKAQQPYTKKFRVGPYEGHLVGPQQWEVRKGGQTISKHRQMNEASTAASRY